MKCKLKVLKKESLLYDEFNTISSCNIQQKELLARYITF